MPNASKGEVRFKILAIARLVLSVVLGFISAESLSAALGGVSVIDAGRQGTNAAVYAAKRPIGAFVYPLVRVYANGALVGEFSGRGLTQSSLVEKVNALIKVQ